MALPSQTERTTTGTRPVMSRGDKRGSKGGSSGYLIGGAVVLVAAAGFGLWKYAGQGAGGSAPAPVAAADPADRLTCATARKEGLSRVFGLLAFASV